jgi:hypothetical protein
MDPIIRNKPSSAPFFVGLLLTVLYLVGIAFYFYRRGWYLGELTIEEFSGLLAGVFSPLALLWLVLGYRQQGHELRHSADALWLQGEELRHSVEQQKELVSAARDQIDLDRTVLESNRQERERMTCPILRVVAGGNVGDGDGSRRHLFGIENTGPVLRDVQIYIDGNPHGSQRPMLATGVSQPLHLTFKIGLEEKKLIRIEGVTRWASPECGNTSSPTWEVK